MTDLINTVFINGQRTTFMNYVNPLVSAEPLGYSKSQIDGLLNAQWGTDLTKWGSADHSYIGLKHTIRFPVAFETRTGNLINSDNYNNWAANMRVGFNLGQGSVTLQSGNNNGVGSNIDIGLGLGLSTFLFAVVNENSFTLASFSGGDRSVNNGFVSFGWLKNGVHTSGQYPRNLYCIYTGNGRRVQIENSTSLQSSLTQNPTLSCQIATPGANSTDVLFRDSISPNNYIGKIWNMIVLPSSAVVGKIYKNTGVDPDTGNIETDQKAFWMCVGNWGTDKIGMRVWTENIE